MECATLRRGHRSSMERPAPAAGSRDTRHLACETRQACEESMDEACQFQWTKHAKVSGRSMPKSMDEACQSQWTKHANFNGRSMPKSVDEACQSQWTKHAKVSGRSMPGCGIEFPSGSTAINSGNLESRKRILWGTPQHEICTSCGPAHTNTGGPKGLET